MEKQCSFVLDTKTSKQCSRRAKISVEKGKHAFCWAHWGIWRRERDETKAAPEPWELFGMKIIPCAKVEKNVRKMLRMYPGEAPDDDAEGLVYCFQLEEGCDDPNYWKIGQVGDAKRLPQRLDYEWRDSRLIEKWPVAFPAYAEALIHLLLQPYRVHRWVLYAPKAPPGRQKRYISTLFMTNLIIQDKLITTKECPDWLPDHLFGQTEAPKEIYYKTKPTERYRVEDEWFYCSYEQLRQVVEEVLKLLNQYKTSPEKWYSVYQ